MNVLASAGMFLFKILRNPHLRQSKMLDTLRRFAPQKSASERALKGARKVDFFRNPHLRQTTAPPPSFLRPTMHNS